MTPKEALIKEELVEDIHRVSGLNRTTARESLRIVAEALFERRPTISFHSVASRSAVSGHFFARSSSSRRKRDRAASKKR